MNITFEFSHKDIINLIKDEVAKTCGSRDVDVNFFTAEGDDLPYNISAHVYVVVKDQP